MVTNILSNTIAASGADITLLARKLNVVVDNGTFPTLTYAQIVSASIQPSLIETVTNVKFSYTAADNTAYSLTVIQTVNGQVFSFTAKYTSGTSATATIIGNALASQFPAGANGLQVTATHTSTNAYITIVGNTGYPLFTGVSGTNVTAAANMTQLTGVTNDYDASPTLFTKAAHGLVTGNTITVVSGAGDTAWVAAAQYRVVLVSSSTFTLQNLTTGEYYAGATADLTSGVLNFNAQVAQGQGTTLATAGITGAASGSQYSQYTFNYNFSGPSAGGTLNVVAGNTLNMYIVEGTASTSPTTNFTNFDERLREVLNAFVAGGTTSDPEAIAIADVD